MFWKDGLPKKIALEYDLSYIIGKDDISFSQNIIWFFRQNMNDDLSQKNTWNVDICCKCSEKMVFPKKIAQEYDIFCIIRKDDIYFPRKYDLREGKWMIICLKKIHGNIIL